MNKKFIRFGAIALLFAMNTYAQQQEPEQLDEVVVSDSKFALPKEKSGKVIVKITAEDLKKKAGQSVASVLSTVAGVEINGNQSRSGKDLGLYIRGGRNHQVLILIDGVPVTDASGISLSYDLRLLPVEQIESIEIMKGASSTLYGSGAATGVINITLKKAGKKAIAGNAYMNIGTQTAAKTADYSVQDYNQGFTINGGFEKINYFASLNSTETTGISEAKPLDSNTKFEDDSFSRLNSVVKIGFTPTEKLSFDFFANFDRMKSDFDGGSFSDDLKNFSLSEQYRIGFSPKYKYNKGELIINTSANVINRDIFSYESLFQAKSRSVNVDAFNKYEIVSQLFVVTGAQFQFHEMSNASQYDAITFEMAKFNMIDPYVTAVYNSDFGLNLNAGARYTIHSKFGNNFVYNVNPSYNFSETFKVLASYSTAFITPSLYQLYSPYGDLNLAPEKDATAEAGFEVSLINKKVVLNAVVFQREEQDAIGFDLMTYKYFNVAGKNKAKGLETMISYAFSDKVKFNGNYTFTELEKQSRILNPKHKVNAAVDVQATTRLAFNLAYQFVSDRYFEYTTYPAPTYDPVLNSEVLKEYQIVNANVRYELIKNRLNVFGAADNILDNDFIETRGYSTRGRNFKLGLNFLF
ncbi:TonB-dependent receptor plug domain-containing protein [Flavobacterium sp. XS2P39]|uniref:TonB-dependent receptor plug domain-containing protein n=1 Tax=Flavobacterium sp. XS2P39 TaxID=3401725 RepID=UPI003AAD4B69